MEEKIIFFNKENPKKVLRKFLQRLDNAKIECEFDEKRNKHIRTIFNSMITRPEDWDKFCEINIQWIGVQFINRITDDGSELTKEILDDIFSYCFRFLFEFYLSTKTDLSMDFELAKRFAFENINEFEMPAKSQINFAVQDMPISIFKSIANNDSIQNIKDFNEFTKSASKLKKDLEDDLDAREIRVNNLKTELSTYESGFNFVGLFEGFNQLSKDKISEKNVLRFWLIIISILIVSPLLAEMYVLYSNLTDLGKVKDVLTLSIIPSISLVVILIYFFRVILYNFKSTKSQLLQIELRKTLCKFIQSYSEFSSKLKEKDKDSLTKFEDIIFSGIVAEDGQIPSTYDGIEQVGRLIKSMKN